MTRYASTSYDRGRLFAEAGGKVMQVAMLRPLSVKEYLDSEKAVVEAFHRHPGGWWYELLNDPESDCLRFRCVDLPSALQTD